MTFKSLLMVNIILKIIYGSGCVFLAFSLAERKTYLRKIMPSILIFSVVEATVTTLISYHDVMAIGYVGKLSYLVTVVAELIIDFAYFTFLFPGLSRKNVFFLLSLANTFLYSTFIGMQIATHLPGFIVGGPLSHSIASSIISIILAALIYIVLDKIRLIYYLRKLSSYPKIYIPMGIIYYLLNVVFYFLDAQFAWWGGIYLVLFFIVGALARDLNNQKTLKESQALIQQQQNYMQRLEEMQKDLRLIQHDHKNMVAGLYAEASEGNVEAVKEYIETKLLEVDPLMQNDLRQLNQLANIGLPELKGLVISKIMAAEKRQIALQCEIMNPLDQIFMEVEDLLRCIGILLDNAIEEAQKQNEATVTLLILKEADKLTVAVKNPFIQKPDLSKIWHQGYSTKGENRGLGLTSYQKILKKYPNLAHETKIEDRNFLQVLMILNPAKKDNL